MIFITDYNFYNGLDYLEFLLFNGFLEFNGFL